MYKKDAIIEYSNYIRGINADTLKNVSIKEGVSILRGADYKNRELYFLDMTTHSTTGTFKDWIACLTVAHCLENKIAEFVTQTSGNTGNALACYASRNKICATIFYPASSRYKISKEFADPDYIKFVELDKPEPIIKQYTAEYSTRLGILWLPDFNLQIEANKLRAYYVQDYVNAHNTKFQWHAQSLSSGYGAMGFYRGLKYIESEQLLGPVEYPSFIGVQQEAVSPYFDGVHDKPSTKRNGLALNEPTLFRSTLPQDMVDEMKEICRQTKGFVIRLQDDVYSNYEELAIKFLNDCGITISTVPAVEGGNIIVEKSGVIATAGVLSQIDEGRIPEKDRILVAITGGTAYGKRATFKPEWILSSTDSIEVLF